MHSKFHLPLNKCLFIGKWYISGKATNPFSFLPQTFKQKLHHNISIVHGCMVKIEKPVRRVTDRHHEACRVMSNSDPERRIFLSIPDL